MDSKINFFKIGIFIIIMSVSLLGVVFWLGKFGFEKKKYDEYAIYFKESISGLNIGSSIKYKGFEVGSVHEIKINPNNSEEIQINVLIKAGTPIKEDNYAILGNIGITGLKYIELKGGTNDSPLLKEKDNGLKIIPSKISELTTLFNSTGNITNEIIAVLAQIKKILNDENINTITELLSTSKDSAINIEKLSSYLIKNEEKIDELIANISNLSKVGSKSFDSMDKSADSFKILTNKLSLELQKGSFNIKDISEDGFAQLNEVLKNLEITLYQVQKLIDDLEQSPSDIIFKQKTIKYGPGEKNEK